MMGAMACAQVLGLDEIRERSALPSSSDGGDAGDDARTDADATLVECATHADCLDKKAAERSTDGAVCVAGKCVDLRLYSGTTPVCYQNAFPSNEVLRSSDAVLVAAFVPLSNATFDSEPVMMAYRLALEEFLPENTGASQGGPRLAMIACSSDEKNGVVDQGVDHVVDDLKVPVILAGFDPAKLSIVAQKKTIDAGTFIVNPSVASESLKFLPTNGLVLSLLGAPAEVALAYQPVVSEVESLIHKARGSDGGVKVALIDTDKTLVEKEMANVILNGPAKADDPSAREPSLAVKVNGVGPFENMPDLGTQDLCAPAGNFCWLPIGDNENKDPLPDYAEIQEKLVAFRPDVVIALTREEIVPIVACYERELLGLDSSFAACTAADAWPKPGPDGGAPPLPYWILGPRNGSELLGRLPTGKSQTDHELFDEVRRRFAGVQFAGPTKTAERDAWLRRMQTRWGSDKLEAYKSQENSYDAVYWVGYGIVGKQPYPESGDPFGLRAGVRRMFGGPATVTPPATGTKFNSVLSGKVTFEGALGPADIDETLMTWRSVGGVYCYKDKATDNRIGQPIEPSIVYDTKRYLDGGLQTQPDAGCSVWK